MFPRLTRFVLIASLFGSMGGHLAVLQTVAWAKMALNFSRHDSVRVSLQKTFDGNHPCAMCLKIKKATQTGDSLSASLTQIRPDQALLSSSPQIKNILISWSLASASAFPNPRLSVPDSPPPKAIFS